MIPAVIGFVILVVLVAWMISIYNRLVAMRQLTLNAWAQIDVQTKRRYDLIPNLVETVKGMMSHERDTLERVIQARNQALSADSPGEKGQAEGRLNAALGGFFGLVESYPDLKADTNMVQLQDELRETESKISFARQYYNDTVTSYNTMLETFPSSLVAGMGSFKPRERFEIENPIEREAVKVQF